jgi:hypothetical protein
MEVMYLGAHGCKMMNKSMYQLMTTVAAAAMLAAPPRVQKVSPINQWLHSGYISREIMGSTITGAVFNGSQTGNMLAVPLVIGSEAAHPPYRLLQWLIRQRSTARCNCRLSAPIECRYSNHSTRMGHHHAKVTSIR